MAKRIMASAALIACLGAAVLAARPSVPAAAPAAGNGANVLLITIDTLRFDRVGFYSSKYVKTPTIDSLARGSVAFFHAYAHNPLTRPSHTNIMTGTVPPYHGVSDNPGFRLEPRFLTLAEHLKSAGYQTGAFIGAFVLDSRFGLDQGFDTYDDSHGQSEIVARRAEEVVTPGIEWISSRKGPWFCWLHLFDPHDPYTPPEPFGSAYPDDPYSGEVAYVDQQLGRLFAALDKIGARSKTVVVLTADHGEALGEKEELYHGFFAYNSVLHVPLFISAPGLAPAVVADDVGHVDIFPTICDLLGISAPPRLQGESLVPLAAGRGRRNEAIYFESLSPNFFLDAAPLRGFIRNGLKYIDQPNEEVYDLSADPGEENNLASRSDLPALRKELDDLRKRFKGPGTTQDVDARGRESEAMMKTLGYVAGRPAAKRKYGPADDLKSLQPLIVQLRRDAEEFRDRDPALALKKINNIILIRPSYVTAYITLATLYSSRDLHDKAAAVLRDGLAKNPESLPLLEKLGVVLVLAKKYEDAIDPLEECARRDPQDPDYWNYLGRALMGLGDFGTAEERFGKALEIDPEMVEAYNNLGYLHLMIYRKSGERSAYDRSIENFDKALALNPKLVSALKGKEAALAGKF